jgi:PncC family amidohydrolase
MTSYISSWFTGGSKPHKITIDSNDVTVSVAESVTAGALANTLCSAPGASSYFNGGIVAYSIASKKDILGVDVVYAEQHNFANPFTTAEMAKAVVKMLKSRIGIATTGYSLPLKRAADEKTGVCELNVEIPYAYICMYDSATDSEFITKVEYTSYDAKGNQAIQKAAAQAHFALKAHKMYTEYVEKIKPHLFKSEN